MTTDKLRKHADLMGKFIINEAKKIEAEHECPECHKMVCVCESGTFESRRSDVVSELEELIAKALKVANEEKDWDLHDAVTHLMEAFKILKKLPRA